ncbi:hypothetical protein, partial [Paraburkholderia domus]
MTISFLMMFNAHCVEGIVRQCKPTEKTVRLHNCHSCWAWEAMDVLFLRKNQSAELLHVRYFNVTTPRGLSRNIAWKYGWFSGRFRVGNDLETKRGRAASERRDA